MTFEYQPFRKPKASDGTAESERVVHARKDLASSIIRIATHAFYPPEYQEYRDNPSFGISPGNTGVLCDALVAHASDIAGCVTAFDLNLTGPVTVWAEFDSLNLFEETKLQTRCFVLTRNQSRYDEDACDVADGVGETNIGIITITIGPPTDGTPWLAERHSCSWSATRPSPPSSSAEPGSPRSVSLD